MVPRHLIGFNINFLNIYEPTNPALSPINLIIVTFLKYVNRSSPQGIVAEIESAKFNSHIDEYGKGSKSKSKVGFFLSFKGEI